MKRLSNISLVNYTSLSDWERVFDYVNERKWIESDNLELSKEREEKLFDEGVLNTSGFELVINSLAFNPCLGYKIIESFKERDISHFKLIDSNRKVKPFRVGFNDLTKNNLSKCYTDGFFEVDRPEAPSFVISNVQGFNYFIKCGYFFTRNDRFIKDYRHAIITNLVFDPDILPKRELFDVPDFPEVKLVNNEFGWKDNSILYRMR